jgi:hypothetical protein
MGSKTVLDLHDSGLEIIFVPEPRNIRRASASGIILPLRMMRLRPVLKLLSSE